MAIARGRGQSRGPDIWPGFVDALSTLLMVIIFLLMLFFLAQFFLGEALSGRDAALQRLTEQVNELTELLSLERQANADLRLSVAQLSAELQDSTAARDDLGSALAVARREQDDLQRRLDMILSQRADLADRVESESESARSMQMELEELRAARAELESTLAADRETIDLQLRELVSLRRDIESLRKLRSELETEVNRLATTLMTANEELTTLRDRRRELEARLSTEEERTSLAQQEIEEKDVRVAELESRVEETSGALDRERLQSAQAQEMVERLNQQITQLRDQLARIQAALEASEETVRDQNIQIADLGRRLNVALANKVEELARYRSEFFGRLREILGSRQDVRIEGDRFVFQSEVLFDPGSADLGPGARTQLGNLSEALLDIAAKIPDDINWILQVEGHTDKRPISSSIYPSNWELSTSRAISVAKFLISQGVPPSRVSAAGYGEYQPIDPGEDEIAYRRNRRIELKLTSR